MLVIKIISALFGLLGVTELATQVKYNKSSLSVVRDLSVGLFQKLNDRFSQKREPSFAHVDDEVEHRRSWNYKDEEHGGDHRLNFHKAMQYKMNEVKTCHKACGWDVACHKACPKPWAKFQEKCDKVWFQEMLEPTWVCHKECRRTRGGHSCHAQCPKPQGPELARKMEEKMQCHLKCGQGDHMCHHACPRPMAHILPKCKALKDIIGCHVKCTPGDHVCHHACPKVWSLWHLDGKMHDVAQRFQDDGSTQTPSNHLNEHSPEEDDEIEHRRWWNYKDEEHEADHHLPFHKAMQYKMTEVKACNMACGLDVACHKACPKPWAKFQEKCEMLEPIWVCHQECRRSRGGPPCHAQCPKPQCPELARKMEEIVEQCHIGDHACLRPMALIIPKCKALQDSIGCHAKCTPGDHACHHACPHVWSIWHLDRKVHDIAQRFDHYHHNEHSPEEDDEVRHQKWWGYNVEEHHIDHRSNFHKVMAEKMHEVKECHERCGWDLACHQGCPKPWKHFQEKCDKFKPIYECHKKCIYLPGASIACPQSCHAFMCPVPPCPKMAQKLVSSLKCHQNCGHHKIANFLHDRCHAACDHNIVHIQQRCDTLQHVTQCHQKCGPLDIKCHGSCMRMHDLWHKTDLATSGGQELLTVQV